MVTTVGAVFVGASLSIVVMLLVATALALFPSHKRAYAVPFTLYVNGLVVPHYFPSVDV